MLNQKTSSPITLVLGVFLGSATWWLTLSLGIGWMRDRLTANHMAWINRISGTIIVLFGIVALFSI
jgi:arginine exporter protein ArgO